MKTMTFYAALAPVVALALAAGGSAVARSNPQAQPPAAAVAAEPNGHETLPRELDPTQNPDELAATDALNARVAADLADVDRRVAEIAAEEEAKQAAWEVEQARYRQVVADAETARANHEAAVRAADAARAQWERDRAAWEEQVRLCERGVRSACAPTG